MGLTQDQLEEQYRERLSYAVELLERSREAWDTLSKPVVITALQDARDFISTLREEGWIDE